jgi:ammonium transporter, Amt family
MNGGVAEAQLSFGLCLVFILLVPLAIAGLALINAGLGRSRSAAHAMTCALSAVAIAALVYCIWGAAFAGYPAKVDSFGGIYHGMSAGIGFFLSRIDLLTALPVMLSVFAVSLTSVIVLGSSGDRWRISAACISTAVLAGWIYPIFSRLAFVTPLVAELSRSWLGAPLVDSSGSGFINAVGGLTALSIVWLVGPRLGKYPPKGMPAAIPAHNQVFVLFGCMLAWVGWLGLNAAGAILYTGMQPERSALVIINTTFSAAAAALTAAVVTRVRFRRPDASLIANGWMAGLVASSAGCAMLKPATAIITGIVAGTLVVLSVEWFELHLKVDDPCGSISVHAVCGIWGLLAVGIFSGSGAQFTAQIVEIATLLGLIFPMAYGLNWVLNRFVPYRVSADGERQGLDLYELGADAYPEFVVHADEFLQR